MGCVAMAQRMCTLTMVDVMSTPNKCNYFIHVPVFVVDLHVHVHILQTYYILQRTLM